MNRGRRLQALSWTTQGFSTAKLKKMEIKRANQDLKDIGRKVDGYLERRITDSPPKCKPHKTWRVYSKIASVCNHEKEVDNLLSLICITQKNFTSYKLLCVCSQRPRPEPELKRPVFRIIPDKVVLEPFENCVITLEGSSQE